MEDRPTLGARMCPVCFGSCAGSGVGQHAAGASLVCTASSGSRAQFEIVGTLAETRACGPHQFGIVDCRGFVCVDSAVSTVTYGVAIVHWVVTVVTRRSMATALPR